MTEPDKCPQCGTPLSPGALAGLCPACLLKAGAAADSVTDLKQPTFNPPAIAELAPKFPQLEILELIGKGGMGAVYKARQKQLDRIVALKVLPPGVGTDAAFAERFTREARALAKLNHPNIVTLYEFGEASGQFYFLMEFVDGVNLRQLLHNTRIAPREALAIVPQICDALQFAHDHGVVHRDIKPENILLDRHGRVKVADFGLAKIIGGEVSEPAAPRQPSADSTNLTDAGKVMGTPNYMSPEQAENPSDVDHRADIYALGVVFYQMLTGELPGKTIEPPSRKVHIDVRLDEIVLRALEKKPELRYQKASVFKTQLETIYEEPGKSEIQNPKPRIRSRFSRTNMATATLVAIIVMSAVLLALKRHYAAPPTTLTQSEFICMFEANQIAHATIKMSGQRSQLTPVSGYYFQTDKNGKLTKKEVPFMAPNILLTQKMLDELLPSDRIEAEAPNTMLMGVVWGVAPFLILAVLLLVPGIIIYIIWRAVKQPAAAGPAPPLLKKPDTFLRWFAVTTLAMMVVLFVIAILGLIAAVAIPNFIRGQGQALALRQQTIETGAQDGTSNNFYIGQAHFPRGDSIEITTVERTEHQITVKGHYNLVSADHASLSLYITTRIQSDSPEDASQTMFISKGSGDFELIHSHVMAGLPHVSMYANRHSFADLYFGTQDEAGRESRLNLSDNQAQNDASLWGFGPVIETIVESSNGDRGYDLDRAYMTETGNPPGPGADLVVRKSPNGTDSLYFVGTRAELFPDGDVRWTMAACIVATNLSIIPESPDAFTNAYGLAWHEALIPQPPTHPEACQPKTYEFQTLEGNIGLLQVLGTNANPRGVGIRYKLLQKQPESAAENSTINGEALVVVDTFPLSGAKDVESGETEIGKAIRPSLICWSFTPNRNIGRTGRHGLHVAD
ncbi:MAG: serine/threonine-protein kinase [Verrucomicrobiota bacterium]